jgi:catechol-2,3-dioxygenase
MDSPGRTSLAAVASAKAASGRSGVRMLHLALRANRKNFLAAQEELKRRGIQFEFSDHEISHSIYFRDPDGHELEITTYDLPG